MGGVPYKEEIVWDVRHIHPNRPGVHRVCGYSTFIYVLRRHGQRKTLAPPGGRFFWILYSWSFWLGS